MCFHTQALCLTACWAFGQTPATRPATLMLALNKEIVAGLAERDVRDTFDRYQAYSSGRLDASAGAKTYSDKTGNCRLAWYDSLIRDQLSAPAKAEEFSRLLHDAVGVGPRQWMPMVRKHMGRAATGPGRGKTHTAPAGPLALLRQTAGSATRAVRRAFAPLNDQQYRELREHLYAITTGTVSRGPFWADKKKGRALCDVMEMIDHDSLYDAAEALLALCNPRFLASLAGVRRGGDYSPDGVTGAVLDLVRTDHGVILVGGAGDNTYDLDKLGDVCAVVDTGGNDTYLEGTTTRQRPVLIVIDLAGDDVYRGEKPGIQGGAVLGASMLVDLAGNDTYEAKDVAQGSCLAGVGILIDHGGNDTYRGLRRVQGHAICGPGIHIDRAGDDSYHAALHAQGSGGPLGFGLLDDFEGADHYYAGGLYLDGYGDTPGYAGWSQGVGVGPRGTANGGIGVLLDGSGDDLYECDYFSHGGGYWFAVGIARDFGGNDKRLGATRLAYDGSPRKEPIYLRWGIGFGCHYALGFVFDDAGDDLYGGNIVGLGFSWDIAVGGLCDFGGNDRYEATSAVQGQARQAGLAVLFDVGGNDVYLGTEQGVASASVTYHPQPACGGNFSFVVDYGGKDSYGCGAADNSYSERGSPSGFLIDRAGVPSD